MDLKESRIEGQRVYEGVLLNVEKDRVLLPNGKESIREYIKHPGAVLVIPVLPDGRIVMERQFRYPTGMTFLELPAGKLDPGESPEQCGHRELLEETGYRAGSLRYLTRLHPCIGYTDEVIYIYAGFDLSFEGEQSDADEFLEIFSLELHEAYEAMLRGEISDAKTMIALFWAKHHLEI